MMSLGLKTNNSNEVQQKLTWLPVSTERLVITLPQHEEIYHIWHVVIPGGETRHFNWEGH